MKDYFMLGQETPVMKALWRWVEEGWSRVSKTQAQHSWRFFTKGIKTAELACGIVRDSRDGAGRPFPLMIMGYGKIEQWEQQWELLPHACDDVWERMEFLSVKRFFDLDDLKGDLGRLPAPVLIETYQEVEGALAVHDLSPKPADAVTIPLAGMGDDTGEAVAALRLIRGTHKMMPTAVFIGGTPEKIFLTAFMKSLRLADFEKLWARG